MSQHLKLFKYIEDKRRYWFFFEEYYLIRNCATNVAFFCSKRTNGQMWRNFISLEGNNDMHWPSFQFISNSNNMIHDHSRSIINFFSSSPLQQNSAWFIIQISSLSFLRILLHQYSSINRRTTVFNLPYHYRSFEIHWNFFGKYQKNILLLDKIEELRYSDLCSIIKIFYFDKHLKKEVQLFI